MLPVEQDLATERALNTHPPPLQRVLTGWGGGEGAPVQVLRGSDVEAIRECLRLARSSGMVARGMGRSYGDAAQLRGGLVFETTELRGFELDREHGVVLAMAGTTLAELLDALVPLGWIVPVVPGTQHVSVGGAIASDIHGKNHGSAGTFGTYVREITLLTAAGELLELGPEDDVFQATVGGMGLTGVIVSARVALRPVRGAMLSVDSDRVEGLDQALGALSAEGGPHRVAWLDLLSGRPRGVVTRAEHVDAGGGQPTMRARATVPSWWPAGPLRVSTVRAFNAMRFRRAPRRERGLLESFGEHMFPLDVLNAWPRLYGPRGFVQYQLVVPHGAEHVLERVIELLREERVPCFLSVLKDFGEANGAPLSFPLAGWTLTLDLPRAAQGLDRALDRCDSVVAEAGGRVYLAKDDRLRPEVLRAMYQRLGEWQAVRDRVDPERVWRSDLALRSGLIQTED
jgi:decaprenylphospho-beta-D-ribofuranose 2-oxidase